VSAQGNDWQPKQIAAAAAATMSAAMANKWATPDKRLIMTRAFRFMLRKG